MDEFIKAEKQYYAKCRKCIIQNIKRHRAKHNRSNWATNNFHSYNYYSERYRYSERYLERRKEGANDFCKNYMDIAHLFELIEKIFKPYW